MKTWHRWIIWGGWERRRKYSLRRWTSSKNWTVYKNFPFVSNVNLVCYFIKFLLSLSLHHVFFLQRNASLGSQLLSKQKKHDTEAKCLRSILITLLIARYETRDHVAFFHVLRHVYSNVLLAITFFLPSRSIFFFFQLPPSLASLKKRTRRNISAPLKTKFISKNTRKVLASHNGISFLSRAISTSIFRRNLTGIKRSTSLPRNGIFFLPRRKNLTFESKKLLLYNLGCPISFSLSFFFFFFWYETNTGYLLFKTALYTNIFCFSSSISQEAPSFQNCWGSLAKIYSSRCVFISLADWNFYLNLRLYRIR